LEIHDEQEKIKKIDKQNISLNNSTTKTALSGERSQSRQRAVPRAG